MRVALPTLPDICNYGAIDRKGRVDYSECFQCLDCVTIFVNPKTCVPRVIEARRAGRAAPPILQRPTPGNPVPAE